MVRITRYKSVRGSLSEHNIVFDISAGHHHDGKDSRLIDPFVYVSGYINVALEPTQVLDTGSIFTLQKTIYYKPTGSGLYSFYPYPTGSRQGDYGFLVRGDIQLIRVFGNFKMNTGSTIPNGYYVLAENDTEVNEGSNTFVLDKTLKVGNVITGSQTINVFAEFKNIHLDRRYGQNGQWQIFLDNILLWSGSILTSTYSGSLVGNPVDVVIGTGSQLTLKMKGLRRQFRYKAHGGCHGIGVDGGCIDPSDPTSGGDVGGGGDFDPGDIKDFVEAANRKFQALVSAPSGSGAAAGAGGMQIFVSGSKIFQTYTTGSSYTAYDTGWINIKDASNYNGIGDVSVYLLNAYESGSKVQVKLNIEPVDKALASTGY